MQRLSLLVAGAAAAASNIGNNAGKNLSAVRADPSTSWLSFAQLDVDKIITAMNATVVVPANPEKVGADPSFWYGLQTAKGTGALIQPILAWGQTYRNGYGIFHEVFDWNNGRDSRSPQAYEVKPGDTLTQSVRYKASDNSYDMYIASKDTGRSISWNYKLESKQTVPETTAYIVVEHKPSSCKEYPASGGITFSDIYVEVDGTELKNPNWVLKDERPACNSKAVIVDSKTVSLKWDASA